MTLYQKSIANNTIQILPSAPAKGSVIWLHGLGADGNDFVPIVSELDLANTLPLRFIFPHAPLIPVTINNGHTMRAWFDIYSSNIDQRVDQKGIDRSINIVHQLIEQEESAGIPTDKIVLAGFSQGAVMALLTGLTFSKPLAGLMALSGFLPMEEKTVSQFTATNRTVPIFIAHGTQDGVVPFQLGETTANMLNQYQYPVTWKEYPMPHSVSAEEVRDIATWLHGIY